MPIIEYLETEKLGGVQNVNKSIARDYREFKALEKNIS